MPTYDYVIAGGGPAGLSLACQMVHSPLREAAILSVDRRGGAPDNRLWSYWTHTPTLSGPVVAHTWRRLHVTGLGGGRTEALPSCRRGHCWRHCRGWPPGT